MSGVLVTLFCGALLFVEQDIPGIRVGRTDPLSGEPWRNFRQGDIDRDGKTDLVLPDSVAFQRGDGFRKEDLLSLPHLDECPACDLWDSTLYLRLPSRLVAVKWAPEGWQTVLDNAVAWPHEENPPAGTSAPPVDRAPAVHFERFLQDLDGDGVPEVVVASQRGLHVYAKSEAGYSEAAVLDVLPPLRLVPCQTPSFWPPDARPDPSPELQLSSRFFLAGNQLVTLESDLWPGEQARYRIRRYVLESAENAACVTRLVEDRRTPLMAASMRPCRLNEDDVMDFAGGRWLFTPGGVLHAPVYETLASTDGGETMQFVRSMSLRPRCSFVDFNGDGRLDMVTESSGLFAGGVRETVARFMSADALDHELRIHLQDEKGTFPGTPDIRGTFRVNIGKVIAGSGERFARYLASELADITGDFDGDGIRDVLIHSDARLLQGFRGTREGFRSRPLLEVETQPDWRYAVDDIDGDGRSDIVFRWMDPASADGYERCRVFLTREKTQ